MLFVTTFQRRALIATMFLITATFGFLQPFVPLYLQASGLNLKSIGQLLALSTGAALLLQPLLGRFTDRIDSRKPVMCAAAFAAGCAYELYRRANSPAAFALLSAIGVNGTIYLNAAGGALLGRIAANSGRGGAAYAEYRVWGSVGYIIVALASGSLLQANSGTVLTRDVLSPIFLYGPVLFFAIAGLVWFVPDFKAAPVPAEAAEETNAALNEPLGAEIDPNNALVTQKPSVNPNPFLLSLFFYIFSLYGASAFLSPYMKSFGASPKLITGMFAAGVVCEVLVMTRVGRLTDKWGRRPALAITYLLLPIRLTLYHFAATPTQVALIQMLHGINFGIMGTIAVVFMNDIAAEHERGASQARLAAVQGLANALGPMTCGWIAELYGLREMFFAMAGVAVIAAIIFMTSVRESHPSPVSLLERGYRPLRPLWKLLSG